MSPRDPKARPPGVDHFRIHLAPTALMADEDRILAAVAAG